MLFSFPQYVGSLHGTRSAHMCEGESVSTSLLFMYLCTSSSIVPRFPAQVSSKLSALRSLESRLKEIQAYMTLVSEGKLPINHEIMYQLQDVFNLLPNLNIHELVKAFSGERSVLLQELSWRWMLGTAWEARSWMRKMLRGGCVGQ